nr:hypothetical protein [Tanacetum cinerariifolium]
MILKYCKDICCRPIKLNQRKKPQRRISIVNLNKLITLGNQLMAPAMVCAADLFELLYVYAELFKGYVDIDTEL